jgi:sulfatase modifying factor 1
MQYMIRFATLLPFSLAFLSGCLETNYPAREWRLSSGESLELGVAEKWTLDVIRLEVSESGLYEIESRCNKTSVKLYEDGDLMRIWQGGAIDVQLDSQARYAISMDRSSERNCRGPLSLSLVMGQSDSDAGIGEDSDAGSRDTGSQPLSDSGSRDTGSQPLSDSGSQDTGSQPLSETLGVVCETDNDCGQDEWCSTVPDYRRCSPRLFSGAAHQMDFVFVPSAPSGYQQGTPGATNEERPFTATITRNYFVSRTEVTQGQWKAATGGTNGSCFQSTTGTSCTTSNANNNGPVEQVDWYSTLAYANWLSVNQGLSACYTLSGCTDATSGWHDGADSGCTGATFTGLTCTGYRLLTESEWERAARGGTTSTYYWGEATDMATVGLYSWFGGNAGNRTHAVGGKQANVFGLYDMSGNVWEWVWDYFESAYPSSSATDYMGPSSGSRTVRGGSWFNGASDLRSADRNFYLESDRINRIGFRLARTAN